MKGSVFRSAGRLLPFDVDVVASGVGYAGLCEGSARAHVADVNTVQEMPDGIQADVFDKHLVQDQ